MDVASLPRPHNNLKKCTNSVKPVRILTMIGITILTIAISSDNPNNQQHIIMPQPHQD